MKTENISTLKIHKLSQEQYERELAAGNIDENALYFTPDTGDASSGGGITEIPAEYITESELAAKGYQTVASADSKYQPKGNYLTSVPSEYVTETELNAKGYLTQHQDLSSYAKKTDIPTVPTKVSQLTNDSGYLTSVPSEYVTESELNNLPKGNVVYATCETAAATAAKVVTVSSSTNWSLSVGSVVMVYFTTSNSASNVTLNVNGSGAYPIWYNNAEYTSTGTAYTGYAKRVINYMFNGTHWVWIGASYDSNTTYKNVSLGHGYATCDTAEATTAKVGALASYALTLGGIVAVKFTYAVPANATLNINSKGAKNMFYRGAKITANVIKVGDIATFIYDGTQYQLLSIDRWQNDIDAISEEIGDIKESLVSIDLTKYVTKNQGASNVGKILSVGSDGLLTLVDMPSGGGDVVGTLDGNNNILLSGNLADGTYTLKYENTDGTYTEIGNLVVSSGGTEEPELPYTNLANPSSDEWMDGYRITSSGVIEPTDGQTLVNTIPYVTNDMCRVKGMTNIIVALYKNGTFFGRKTVTTTSTDFSNVVIDGDYTEFSTAYDGITSIRFYGKLSGNAEDVIITINEEIV